MMTAIPRRFILQYLDILYADSEGPDQTAHLRSPRPSLSAYPANAPVGMTQPNC